MALLWTCYSLMLIPCLVDAQNFLRVWHGGMGFICPGCSVLDIEGGLHPWRLLFGSSIGRGSFEGPFVLMDEFEEKSLWVKGRFGGEGGRGAGGLRQSRLEKFDEVDK